MSKFERQMIMEQLKKYGLDTQTLITIGIILLGAIIATKLLRWIIDKTFDRDSDRIKVDPTRYKFFKNAISLFVWLIALGALVSMIPKLRALAITIFAGAGILVAILGLAAQQAFSNIIGGIFVVIFRPFRVGDMIKVGSLDYGIVEDITLRHTVINNFENKRIIIPNSTVSSETIINDTIEDTKVCRWVNIGISYDSDIDLAKRIMAEEAEKHPFSIDVRSEEDIADGKPMVVVRVVGFSDSSVDLRALVWTEHPFRAIEMHSELNQSIKNRFDKEGVEIPFPYRTVVYKTDLPPNSRSNTNGEE